MEFPEVIRHRYSVCAYKPDPVPDALLAQVLEAGRRAPTAANKQLFRIIVIHTKGREAELGCIYRRDWFIQALCSCASVGWGRRHGSGPCTMANATRT